MLYEVITHQILTEVIMNAKAETQGGRQDTLKLWAAILLMGAGIYGYYYFADVMA